MNIYIGNLDYKVSEAQLQELFSTYGAVSSAKIINDKFSGKSKGFGFVEMPNDEARNAMNALNGQELNSRAMTATEARPRTEGGGGGGGGERRFNNNRRPRNDY